VALIQISTIEEVPGGNGKELAVQEQKLKTALSKVQGLRVVADSTPAEPGTKSGPGGALGFAMEVVASPHVVSAVGVVVFEWLRHNLGKSVQLVVEGEKIVVESGSPKHVQDLVNLLEQKLRSNA